MSLRCLPTFQNAKFATFLPLAAHLGFKKSVNQKHPQFSTSSSPITTPLLRSPEFLQRGFSDSPNQTSVKILHALYLTTVGPNQRSIFCTNTLIAVYSRFGNVHQAREVFNRMHHRNAATWNAMISGYVSGDLVGEAAELFSQMRFLGLSAGGFAVSSLISGGLGFQLHSLVLKNGVISDVFVGTSLLHCYGSSGFISHASHLFDEMPTRNLITWTAMIVSLSENQDPAGAAATFRVMRAEGVQFNQNTLTAAISSSSDLADQLLGLQVLGQALRAGFESNLSFSNSLMSMLGRFDQVTAAKRVFSSMPERDVVSWNSVISASAQNGLRPEAFGLFSDMVMAGSPRPNPTTLSSLLSAHDPSAEDVGPAVMVVHGLALRLGLHRDVILSNSLLSVYSDAGMPSAAARLFSDMPDRDSISWNTMLARLARDGTLGDTFRLFSRLLRTGSGLNDVTFSSLFTALADSGSVGSASHARVLHAMAAVSGLDRHMAVGNSLVSVYGRLRMTGDAVRVSATMPVRDTITWNALIGCHADNGETPAAVAAFRSMCVRDDVRVDHISVVNLLGAFLSPEAARTLGRPLHGFIVRSGLGSDIYVRNSLVTTYADCGDFGSSEGVYAEAGRGRDDPAAVNAMVAAYARNGRGEAALRLFRAAHGPEVIRVDHFSISGALAAAAGLAAVEEGGQAHCLGMKLGFAADVHVINAAMDMYGKCGEIGSVLGLLPAPPDRTRVSWNVVLAALSRHGMVGEAREVFREMAEVGPGPDRVTFVSILTACSHGGLVAEGLAYYGSMEAEFGVRPDVEHHGCVVDLLGRAGRTAEAERFVAGMAGPTDGRVWRTLLATCRVHRDVRAGRRAAGRLVEMDPGDDSAYVLWSNVCAAGGRWGELAEVREAMSAGGVRKSPACSWVKWSGGVATFRTGGGAHPDGVEELRRMVREAGYVPDTGFAMYDTDDEQKEEGLWAHSERLALAFCLTRLPAGGSVRIFKNIRVCGDCHAFFKVACSVLGRVILLRDPHRFHLFQGGCCSCMDFW